MDVQCFDFSVRCRNCMSKMGIKKLMELTARSGEEIANVRNVGKKSLEEIDHRLSEIGLFWQMTERDWLIWGMAHIDWIKKH